MNLVITGSSSGIGRALTEHLLARGDRVWGIARSDQAGLVAAGGNFQSSRCDVADWAQVMRVATEVTAAWPHVDGLVTCAGLHGELGPAVTADPLRWSATVRANLDGTYYALRAFHALLAKAPRRAKVICLSGGGATKARANFSAYGVAKTGIVRLVETVAEELRGQPIDLTVIAPDAINTRLTDEIIALGAAVVGDADYQAALKQKAGGGGSIAKVAGLVEWLLSPASDGISGRFIAARWDPWSTLGGHAADLAKSDIYTLRRITPEDRGAKWD
jgi:NAD(P)-dependent dehydrogenase (short-subunit alcohol dehydrogenase family)